jgi:hypothetical protein
MLSILGCKGNANQNYINISLHSGQNAYHQEHTKNQMLAGMWEAGVGTFMHCS